MEKQKMTKKIAEKVAERIPSKYFVPVMGGIAVSAATLFYTLKALAYNQCDDPDATGLADYIGILNCTDDGTGAPEIPPGIDLPVNPSADINDVGTNPIQPDQPSNISEEIYLAKNNSEDADCPFEPVDELGKDGGIKAKVYVDPLNGTVDVTEIAEVLPMPSSYTEETLPLHEPLFLNSTNGNTYEINLMDLGNEQAMLEITKQETGESEVEFFKKGYPQTLNFGNETLKLGVDELFNGEGADGKFLKVSCETYSNE